MRFIPSTYATPNPLKRLTSGNYYEGGYAYAYNGQTGDITIILSPLSSSAKKVEMGSKAYNAIYEQIASGVAKPISNRELEAKRGATGTRVAEAAAKVFTGGGTAPAVFRSPGPAASPSQATGGGTSIFDNPMFWPIAIGAGVLVGGTVMILLIDSQGD